MVFICWARRLTMANFKYAEQSEGSTVIDFILSDGNKEKVQEKDVIAYLEAEGLNISEQFDYNDSPLGDGDPAYDIYTPIEIDPIVYLDNEKVFQATCELYYKNLIEKR